MNLTIKLINDIPYLYDPLWIQHNIHYWEFQKYKFIKDVSLKNPKYFLPLLLFLKEGEYYLFSAGDYINTPYFYPLESYGTYMSHTDPSGVLWKPVKNDKSNFSNRIPKDNNPNQNIH